MAFNLSKNSSDKIRIEPLEKQSALSKSAMSFNTGQKNLLNSQDNTTWAWAGDLSQRIQAVQQDIERRFAAYFHVYARNTANRRKAMSFDPGVYKEVAAQEQEEAERGTDVEIETKEETESGGPLAHICFRLNYIRDIMPSQNSDSWDRANSAVEMLNTYMAARGAPFDEFMNDVMSNNVPLVYYFDNLEASGSRGQTSPETRADYVAAERERSQRGMHRMPGGEPVLGSEDYFAYHSEFLDKFGKIPTTYNQKEGLRTKYKSREEEWQRPTLHEPRKAYRVFQPGYLNAAIDHAISQGSKLDQEALEKEINGFLQRDLLAKKGFDIKMFPAGVLDMKSVPKELQNQAEAQIVFYKKTVQRIIEDFNRRSGQKAAAKSEENGLTAFESQCLLYNLSSPRGFFIIPGFKHRIRANGFDKLRGNYRKKMPPGSPMPIMPLLRSVPAPGGRDMAVPNRDDGNGGRRQLTKNWISKDGTGLASLMSRYGSTCDAWFKMLLDEGFHAEMKRQITGRGNDFQPAQIILDTINCVLRNRTNADALLDALQAYPTYEEFEQKHLRKGFVSAAQLTNDLRQSGGRDKLPVRPKGMAPEGGDAYEELRAITPDKATHQFDKAVELASTIGDAIRDVVITQRASAGKTNQETIQALEAEKEELLSDVNLSMQYKANVLRTKNERIYALQMADRLGNAEAMNVFRTRLYDIAKYLYSLYENIQSAGYDDDIRRWNKLTDALLSLSHADRSATAGMTKPEKKKAAWTPVQTTSKTDEETMMRKDDFELLKSYGYQTAKMMDFLSALMIRSCRSGPPGAELHGGDYSSTIGKSEKGQIYFGVKYAYRLHGYKPYVQGELQTGPFEGQAVQQMNRDVTKSIGSKVIENRRLRSTPEMALLPATRHLREDQEQQGKGDVRQERPFSSGDLERLQTVTGQDWPRGCQTVVENITYMVGGTTSPSQFLNTRMESASHRDVLDYFYRTYGDVMSDLGMFIDPLAANLERLEVATRAAISAAFDKAMETLRADRNFVGFLPPMDCVIEDETLGSHEVLNSGVLNTSLAESSYEADSQLSNLLPQEKTVEVGDDDQSQAPFIAIQDTMAGVGLAAMPEQEDQPAQQPQPGRFNMEEYMRQQEPTQIPGYDPGTWGTIPEGAEETQTEEDIDEEEERRRRENQAPGTETEYLAEKSLQELIRLADAYDKKNLKSVADKIDRVIMGIINA